MDDVEYGVRNKFEVITINGISINRNRPATKIIGNASSKNKIHSPFCFSLRLFHQLKILFNTLKHPSYLHLFIFHKN